MKSGARIINRNGRLEFLGDNGKYITNPDFPLAELALREAYESGNLTKPKYSQFSNQLKIILATRDKALTLLERSYKIDKSYSILDSQQQQIRQISDIYQRLKRAA